MDAETGEEWGDDPGWRLNWRVIVLLIPYSHLLYRRGARRARGDPLVNLRHVWLSFPGSLLSYGLVRGVDRAAWVRGRMIDGNWIYFFGILGSVPAFVRLAPTKAAFIHEQDELTNRGCALSLIEAIRRTPPKRK